MQRIAITGSSGYYGRKLIEHARRVAPTVRILGIDVVPPRDSAPDEFVKLDIRHPDVQTTLASFQSDTIVHLAFVLNPTHDNRQMHDINVGGTQNVFAAVRSIRPQRFLMSSSATAYGAWPDNPIPMHETWRLKAREKFQYSADKTAIEAAIRLLADELPDVAVSWTRPAIICGENVENFLSRLILNLPFMILPDGKDVPMQFVHESDCAAATWEILFQNARGPFNVAPPDWVPIRRVAELTNRRAVKLPYWSMKLATTIWWGLRLPVFDFPASLHDFVRYPWVVAPTRLQDELGFRFQHSAEETLMEMWAEHSHKKGRRSRK